jgi:hypothetical protein
MRSHFMKWTLRVGLGTVLLLAIPLFPLGVIDSRVAQAAEKDEPLDINTASAD